MTAFTLCRVRAYTAGTAKEFDVTNNISRRVTLSWVICLQPNNKCIRKTTTIAVPRSEFKFVPEYVLEGTDKICEIIGSL